MKSVSVLLFLFFLAFAASAQDAKLAQQYYNDGEFEKAAYVYKKLYENQNNNEYYFNRYLTCLMAVEQFDEAEEAVRDALKNDPKNIRLLVSYGNILERQFKEDEAKEQYEKALKRMPADQYEITRLASTFSSLRKYDYAIRAYEQGGEMIKNPSIFAFNLAELYRRKGDIPNMIANYLNSLDAYPDRQATVQSQLQRYLGTEDDFLELQTQLYDRLQKNPEAYHFMELLEWVFIQKKDYKGALRQAKALDRRLDENGSRIYRLAQTAFQDKDYDAAIAAFQYIVDVKGQQSMFYIDAKREALRALRNKLVEGFNYTEAELREIEQAYEAFLDEFGRNKVTASIVAELADLEARYLNNLDKAIELLQEVIAYPGINLQTQARAKLSLGDYYLIKGEIWEATLLYSQVDKAFPEDQLGHEARYRNAKLSYYNGDFQWAQAQFDVLKGSTSKLIANDAIDMSVFIMDNLGLDTTDQALKLFAAADLLTFQNKFDEAFAKLDTLLMKFPKHKLDDDVLYAKAQIYSKMRQYDKAIELYEKIVEQYPDEIRADNALFEMASLYENQLGDPDKAMSYYEKIFIEYSGSTFSIEARKRYRKLRGDNI
ncbi:MAG: hypothetical protein CMN32_17615 [Saprospirales bacterium]|nr:hypothetical protein [Saprospirales bacterium]